MVEKGITYAVKVGLLCTGLLTAFYFGLQLFGAWHDEWSGYNRSFYVSDGVCNVAMIPIVGDIIQYPGANEDGSGAVPPPSTNMDDTLALIRKAESDPLIEGIFLRIDSFGGAPVASEMISRALQHSPLPSVAFVTEVAASGGYLVASGADTIITSSFSDIGSIGVTMSYIDYTKQNEQDGLQFISLSSGKFKDSGNPDKPLTVEERALFERDLKIYHDEFVRQVSENRNIPYDEVMEIADGSTMPAQMALERKLIDGTGDREEARRRLAELMKRDSTDVIFCE